MANHKKVKYSPLTRNRLPCKAILLRIDSMLDVREEQLKEARRLMQRVNIEKGIKILQTKRECVELMDRHMAWGEVTKLTYRKARQFLESPLER